MVDISVLLDVTASACGWAMKGQRYTGACNVLLDRLPIYLKQQSTAAARRNVKERTCTHPGSWGCPELVQALCAVPWQLQSELPRSSMKLLHASYCRNAHSINNQHIVRKFYGKQRLFKCVSAPRQFRTATLLSTPTGRAFSGKLSYSATTGI